MTKQTTPVSRSGYSQRTQKVLRVTLFGSLSNALLVLIKLFVGIIGHSSALVAEAINSISDFTTDLIALVFIRISGKPQDADHPYGHGKFETLASVVMAGMMIAVGVLVFYRSLSDIIGFFFSGEALTRPSKLTLLVTIISLLIKIFLYRYTGRWAKLLKSSALQIKALDHRGDVMALSAVFLGLAGSIFLGDHWLFLEPAAASVVSLFILRMGWSVLQPAINELTEECLPPEVEEEIRSIAIHTTGVVGVHRLRTRSIGQRYAIELDILVEGSITVIAGHDITLKLEQELRQTYGEDTHITIHVEPEELYSQR